MSVYVTDLNEVRGLLTDDGWNEFCAEQGIDPENPVTPEDWRGCEILNPVERPSGPRF